MLDALSILWTLIVGLFKAIFGLQDVANVLYYVISFLILGVVLLALTGTYLLFKSKSSPESKS